MQVTENEQRLLREYDVELIFPSGRKFSEQRLTKALADMTYSKLGQAGTKIVLDNMNK